MRNQAQRLSGWHPEEIKAAIRICGETLAGLARANKKSPTLLRNALQRRSFNAEQIIARFLGQKPESLWPDRYDARGNPLHRGRAKKSRRPKLRVVR
jgi:Ner family transcriptional regulator